MIESEFTCNKIWDWRVVSACVQGLSAQLQGHTDVDHTMATVAGLLAFFYCNLKFGNTVVPLSGESLKDCEDLFRANHPDLRVAALQFVYIRGIRQRKGYVPGNCQLHAPSNRRAFRFYFIERRLPVTMKAALSFAILGAKMRKPEKKSRVNDVDVDVYGCEKQHDGQAIFYDVLIVGFNPNKYWIIKHNYGRDFGGDENGFMYIAMDVTKTVTAGNDCDITNSVFFIHAEDTRLPSFVQT